MEQYSVGQQNPLILQLNPLSIFLILNYPDERSNNITT